MLLTLLVMVFALPCLALPRPALTSVPCALPCPALPCCRSYLPLAHIYERNNMTVAVHLGGSVGFYSGNVQELLDDVLVSSCGCSRFNI